MRSPAGSFGNRMHVSSWCSSCRAASPSAAAGVGARGISLTTACLCCLAQQVFEDYAQTLEAAGIGNKEMLTVELKL